jgi:hypothetical protein
VTLAFPANTLAGDVLLVAFTYDKSVVPSTVTDSQGNAFAQVGTQLTTPGGARSSVYYAKNIKGGADTVIVTLSAASSYLEAYLSEYSGVNPTSPIDAEAGASGSAGTASSGNATTTVAGDIIYGFCVGDLACTAGSGFNARSTLDGNLSEDKQASSAGSYAATGSASSGWTMQMVALKAASALAAPVIFSSTTASGAVATSFSYQITATNAPTSYGATGLPAGLSLNSATGLISGTPSAAANATVTLSAANSSGTGNATLTLTITASVAASYVREVAGAAHGSPSSVTLAFPANTLAGDVLLVAFIYDDSVVPSTVTDSQGNAFAEVGTQLTTPGGGRSSVYYAKNIKGGADTVVVTLSAASSYEEVYLTEYSGVNPTSPIDAEAGASGSAGTASSGDATTTVAGDIIYGFCVGDGACTAGSGFNARSTLDGNLSEDKQASSAGSYAATGSASSGWTMRMVALKSNSAGVVTQESAGVAVSLSTSSLTFGSEPVGLSALSQTVTVTDTGSSKLSISSIALTGTDPSDFSEVTTCGTSLSAGGSCTIVVIFTPLTSGSLSASLTITDNAPSGSQTVSLSGTGAHDVVLTWTGSGSAGVLGYYVYRGTASGEESTTPLNSTPVDAVTYTDSNVTAGQKYYYVVTAVGSNGTTRSAKSTEVSATVP